MSALLRKSLKYPDIKHNFSDNAILLMEKHYYLKDSDGSLIEHSPSDVFKRVCDFYHRNGVSADKCKRLYEYLMKQIVTFNSPTFYNISPNKNTAQLFACFMSEFEDSMDGITRELSKSAKIFQKGAGIGINYSDLRPRGASIGDGAKKISKETGSSGPISFLRLFNKLGDVVKSSGKRRAAHLAGLNCDHPDIIDFIECKSNPDDRSDFVNANLSVIITDEFIEKLQNDDYIELKWNGVVYNKVKASEIFDKICLGAKTCGDPGILFGDIVQEYNTIARYKGRDFHFKTSNPCGEILGYAPQFSCVLGHINLYKLYLQCGDIQKTIEKVGEISAFLSDFLDINIDQNEYPHDSFAEATKRTRPIGIGIMGYGEMLMAAKIRYGSAEAIKIASDIAEELTLSAFERANSSGVSYEELSDKKNREKLCYVLGLYKNASRDRKERWSELIKSIKSGGHCRNCAVSTVAPTGTTGNIADSGTGGIEPAFALYYKRNVVDLDKPLEIVDFELKRYMNENGIESVDDLGDNLPDYFVCAHDIDPVNRIKTQAAFQKFITFGISSTINLPSSVSIADIKAIYLDAYEYGLKGVTVFVDGCLSAFGGSQVLVKDDDEHVVEGRTLKEQNKSLKISLTKARNKIVEIEKQINAIQNGYDRPIKLTSQTYSFKLSYANGVHEFLVTIGEDNGKPIEVIITLGKSGTDEHAWSEAVGRLISMSLQAGIPIKRLCRKLKGIRGDLSNFVKLSDNQDRPSMVYSIPDLVAKLIEHIYMSDIIVIDGAQMCPSCGNMSLVYEGGCTVCKNDNCDYHGSCS